VSGTGRRLVTLLVVLGIVGVPAVALRALCVGAACGDGVEGERAVPFCSLPASVRDLLAAGFREGRSPDALGVTVPDTLLRSSSRAGSPWPSVDDGDGAATVPLAFGGVGIAGGVVPAGSLDDVAPTIEPLLGFRRPFPAVRSGAALAGVVDPDARSSLVVTIVWKRAGQDAMPAFERALEASETTAIGEVAVGSLPLDPAAVLTTIGSGGLPSDHGITGAVVRSEDGDPVSAWSQGAPTSVIAALGDDLDEATVGDAKIGLVAEAPTDRGLIGGTWYLSSGDADDDDVVIERRAPAEAVAALIADEGYGDGGAPDLLGVTIDGASPRAAAQTREIVSMARATVPDATVVMTATGDAQGRAHAAGGADVITADAFADAVGSTIGAPAVGEVAAGGIFVDQDVVTERNISTQRVVDAMLAVRTAEGAQVLADAFPAFAVAFGRYC
jgi:hypothetical protein